MRLSVLSVAVAACFPLPALAQPAPIDCMAGPITKSFGGSKWLVSSCADGHGDSHGYGRQPGLSLLHRRGPGD